MRFSALLGLVCVAGGLLACANGGRFNGRGNGGDGGSAGSGNNGGSAGAGNSGNNGGSAGSGNNGGSAGAGNNGGSAGAGNNGGSAGAGGSGGSGGSGGTMMTTSTGGMCSETPCKLSSPQCGCAAGQMCTLDMNNQPVCGPAGTISVGQSCATQDCAPGGYCAGVSSTQQYCEQFCDVDADCGAALCLALLSDNMGNPISNVTLCSNDCTPITSAGCPAGLNCLLNKEESGQMRPYGLCLGAGAGTQGASCTSFESCGIGFNCFTVSGGANKCLKYCDTGAPSCPAGTTCQSLSISYKGKNWGACL